MGERKKEEKRKKDSTQTEKENNLLSHFGIGSILSLVRENLLTHSPPIFFEKKEKVENERENLLRIHQLRWALLFFPIVQQLNIICAQLYRLGDISSFSPFRHLRQETLITFPPPTLVSLFIQPEGNNAAGRA